jgi:hypothetical protein
MKVIDLKWLIMFNVMAPAINKKSSAYYKRSSIFTRKKSQMALNFLEVKFETSSLFESKIRDKREKEE